MSFFFQKAVPCQLALHKPGPVIALSAQHDIQHPSGDCLAVRIFRALVKCLRLFKPEASLLKRHHLVKEGCAHAVHLSPLEQVSHPVCII